MGRRRAGGGRRAAEFDLEAKLGDNGGRRRPEAKGCMSRVSRRSLPVDGAGQMGCHDSMGCGAPMACGEPMGGGDPMGWRDPMSCGDPRGCNSTDAQMSGQEGGGLEGGKRRDEDLAGVHHMWAGPRPDTGGGRGRRKVCVCLRASVACGASKRGWWSRAGVKRASWPPATPREANPSPALSNPIWRSGPKSSRGASRPSNNSAARLSSEFVPQRQLTNIGTICIARHDGAESRGQIDRPGQTTRRRG